MTSPEQHASFETIPLGQQLVQAYVDYNLLIRHPEPRLSAETIGRNAIAEFGITSETIDSLPIATLASVGANMLKTFFKYVPERDTEAENLKANAGITLTRSFKACSIKLSPSVD